MIITVNVNVDGNVGNPVHGYLVLTNDNGRLWYYGLYSDKERAKAAVDERPEFRFIAEVTE